MSAPIIWIIFPIIIAGIAFFFRRWKSVVRITLTLITLLLAFSAWLVPIGEILTLGPWVFTVNDRLVFAGRQFVLDNPDRSLLIVIYLTLSYLFSGSMSAKVSSLFVPLGLAIGAILVASLSVQPFLYAALLIEVAVLIGVPLLSSPGKSVKRGVLFYMIFLSFGFPFMLVGGGMISSAAVSGTNFTNLLPTLMVLGFGFAFLLAIFPLNAWIPLLFEQGNPYTSVFVLSVFPTTIIALLLQFTSQYPWLLDFDIIQLIGALMVVTGGIWAAFQRNLGRMLGYAIIIDIGYSILAISQPEGLPIYIGMVLPRILAYGVWALGLSLIREQVVNLDFRSVQGLGRQFPLVALGVIVANFSLAGFPLLASFPFLLALWNQLTQTSTSISLLVLLSSIGLLIGALRSLAVFVMGPEVLDPKAHKNTHASEILLLLGVLAIVVTGIFPNWVYSLITDGIP